jgi:hypothetical protein
VTDTSSPGGNLPQPSRYHVTTRVNDKTICFEHPLDDPFVRQTVHIGWRDLLRGLMRGKLMVTVLVNGTREAVREVMDLEN